MQDQFPEQQFYLFQNKDRLMSLSSLPEIFRHSTTAHLSFRKQGSPFSLHLNDQSPDRRISFRSAYASIDYNRATISASKHRSASSALVSKDQNNRIKVTPRNKMTVNFKEEVQFWTRSGAKQGKMSIINVSNFPYETNNRFNNMTIDMQQTDNLKNMTEFNLKEMEMASNNLEQSKHIVNKTRSEIQNFGNKLNNDLEQFQQYFSGNLEYFYSVLSKLRRQTNEQLKGNKIQLQKVSYQLEISQHFGNDIGTAIEKIASQCIKSPVQKEASTSKQSSPRMDFQQLSSIRKTSRGGTGDQSRRTRLYDLLRKNDNPRKSADWNILQNKNEEHWQQNGV